MENLKYGIFDFFVYAIPGVFFLTCILFVKSIDVLNFKDMFDFTIIQKNESILISIVFISCSYILGFAIASAGNILFKLFSTIINFKKKKDKEKFKKYVHVRELSKENYKYIELWNAMKNLCTTLAMLFLIITTYFSFKFTAFCWPYKVSGILLSVLMLYRGNIYHRWSKVDLESAFENIKNLHV